MYQDNISNYWLKMGFKIIYIILGVVFLILIQLNCVHTHTIYTMLILIIMATVFKSS